MLISFIFIFFSAKDVFAAEGQKAIQSTDTVACAGLLASQSHEQLDAVKAKVDSVLAGMMAKDKVPAIQYSAFTQNGLLISGALGESGVFGHPLRPDSSLFRTASISKLVTSIAVAQLIERGLITPDTKLLDLVKSPIVRYIIQYETPERLVQWSKITVDHLLTHKSGISKDLPNALVFSNSEGMSDNAYPTIQDLYRGILEVEFLFEPGEFSSGFKYSNLGMNLLARIVEAYNPNALPFSEYVRRNIFIPLGMRDSFYDVPKNRRLDLVHSYGSRLSDGGRTLAPPIYSVGSYDGSIGLASSANDLAKIGKEILRMVNGQGPVLLQRRETISYLFQLQTALAPNLGWARGPAWQYLPNETNGVIWFGGSGTGSSERGVLVVSPEKNTGIVVLLNTKDAPRDNYAKAIADIFEADLGGYIQSQMTTIGRTRIEEAKKFLSTFQAPPKNDQPPYPKRDDLIKFEGEYYADLVGVIKVVLTPEGHLTMSGQNLIVEDILLGRFRFPEVSGPAGIDISREPIIFEFDQSGRPIAFRNSQVKIFRKVK